MAIVSGGAPTTNRYKYIQQFCKHWSYKPGFEYSADGGEIRFPSVLATLEAADALVFTIETDEEAAIERLKEVVAKHLIRFAFHEAPLPSDWSTSRPGFPSQARA